MVMYSFHLFDKLNKKMHSKKMMHYYIPRFKAIFHLADLSSSHISTSIFTSFFANSDELRRC
jgi:hypothetical protein